MERNSATATLNIHVHSFGRDDIQSQQPADITLKQLMHGRQKQRVDDSMHPRLLIGFVFRREEAAAAMSKRTTGLCAERGVLAIPILSLERDPHSSSFSTASLRCSFHGRNLKTTAPVRLLSSFRVSCPPFFSLQMFNVEL